MRRFLAVALLVGVSGLGLQLTAQQQQQQPGNQPSAQQRTDSSSQSAQTFQGRIAKAGNQLVFQDASTQTAYQLDDQSKVAPYEGKNVKLMGTLDPKTNALHVIDITPADK